MPVYKIDYSAGVSEAERNFPAGPRIALAKVAVGTLKRWKYQVTYKENTTEFATGIPIEEKHMRVLGQLITYPFGVLEVK